MGLESCSNMCPLSGARLLGLSLCAAMGMASSFPPFDPDDNKQGLPLSKWELGTANWKMFGASTFDEHSHAITLVDEDPKHQGRVWSRRNFKHHSWVMEFALKVKGHGEGNDMGAGVAFWITERREKPGDLYGSQEKFKGIGIFFDTHDDDGKNDNPIIMAVQNDGTMEFNHQKDGQPNRFGGCRAKYRNRNSLVRVKVKFTPGGEDGYGHMQMWLSMKDNGHYDVCFAKERVKLSCGHNSTSCRLGFSSQNMKDAKLGDSVAVTGFRIWDLGEIERGMVRRQLAEMDRLAKQNDLKPEIQEMLGNVQDRAKSVGDQLMEQIMEEVNRDRDSKRAEFVDLHQMINSTLGLKGPITKTEVLKLIQTVKEVQALSMQAVANLRQLHQSRAALELKDAMRSGDEVIAQHTQKHHDLFELYDLKHKTDAKHNKVTRTLRENAIASSSRSWVTYLLCVQGLVGVGLVLYKKKGGGATQIKSHCV